MPLSELQRAVIRLAADDEALRPHLLPLVREARRREVKGKVIAGEKVRITVGESGRDMYIILIEELPGKPFKRRLRRLTYNAYYPGSVLGMWEFLADNINMVAKFRKSMTYDQAKAAATDAMMTQSVEATNRAHQMWVDKDPAKGDQLDDEITQTLKSIFDEEQVFFMEVEPADYVAMTIRGKDFTVDAQWNSFQSYSPNSDLQSHDPSYTKIVQKSKGAARKFFKLMKANPETLRGISFSQFTDWLDRAKVGYDYQFSSWR